MISLNHRELSNPPYKIYKWKAQLQTNQDISVHVNCSDKESILQRSGSRDVEILKENLSGKYETFWARAGQQTPKIQPELQRISLD